MVEVVFVADSSPDSTLAAPWLGTLAEYEPDDDDLIVCAIGNPKVRRKVAETLESRGGRFATFVHDRALIGPSVVVGEGSIICPDVIATTDVVLGRHVHINVKSTIGHDCVLGDFVTLSSGCNLAGGVTVGECAFVATAASVAPRLSISAGAYVGIGSIVIRNVPEDVTVFGNPSRVVPKGPS